MVGTVKYTEEFFNPLTGKKKWIGIELPFDMTHKSPAEMFLQAEAAVKEYASNSPDLKDESVAAPVQVEKKEDPVGIYHQIVSCTDITVLDTFKRLIELLKNDDLMAVYNMRRKELIKGETQQIIEKTDERTQQGTELNPPRKKRS